MKRSGARDTYQRTKRLGARDIILPGLRVKSCRGNMRRHDIRVKRSGARDSNCARAQGYIVPGVSVAQRHLGKAVGCRGDNSCHGLGLNRARGVWGATALG